MNYPKLPLPANLPLLINDSRNSARTLVSELFEIGDTLSTPDVMLKMSRFWPIRVWFSSPVTVNVRKTRIRDKDRETSSWQRCYHYKYDETTDNHVFRGFFWHGYDSDGTFCYKLMRQGRRGHIFEFFDKMVKYEPVFKLSRKD